MVGKVLCYLYLSPERLANEGIFTQQETVRRTAHPGR
ncbi:chromosome partition protein MukE [Shigella flexneri]